MLLINYGISNARDIQLSISTDIPSIEVTLPNAFLSIFIVPGICIFEIEFWNCKYNIYRSFNVYATVELTSPQHALIWYLVDISVVVVQYETIYIMRYSDLLNLRENYFKVLKIVLDESLLHTMFLQNYKVYRQRAEIFKEQHKATDYCRSQLILFRAHEPGDPS